MRKVNEINDRLLDLGRRLRGARLERNDSMAVFAQRLGVSIATVRAMERGEPTVQVGTWLVALWVLNRLRETEHILEPRSSLLDRARAQQLPLRQRASRRPR